MTGASVVLGIAILGFAFWLDRHERGEPQPGDNDATFDDGYLRARHRGRQVVFYGLLVAGGLILVAAAAGPGPVWIASWLAVSGLLILVLMLGMLDAYRTNRYFARKLPELRRQAFSQHFENLPPKSYDLAEPHSDSSNDHEA